MATQQMDEMEQHIANLGQPPCEPPSEDLCPLSANSQMPGDAQVQVEQKETDVLLPNSGAIVKYVPPSSTLALAKSAWDDLKGLGDQAGYCVKCNRTVNLKAEKVVRKKGHSGLTCSACNSVTTSLYRHYNVPNTGFSALSTQEQQAFYAKACELRAQDPDGKLRFSKLQGLLQESLVKREVFLTEKKDTGKFLPLSVYKKKGYDLQPIRERAEQRQDPLLLVCFLQACLYQSLQITTPVNIFLTGFVLISSFQVWDGISSWGSRSEPQSPDGAGPREASDGYSKSSQGCQGPG